MFGARQEGYDHALYRYRVDPAMFVVAREVLHRFAPTRFVTNLGEEPRPYTLGVFDRYS